MSRHLVVPVVVCSMVGAMLTTAARVGAQPDTRTLTPGTVMNVSKLGGTSQAEATVAIDPTNPNRVFVASNVGPFGAPDGMFAAFSTDGGATWTPSAVGGGPPAPCCDPDAVFDSFGNLYLNYLSQGPNRGIKLLRSTDGGQSFTLLASLSDSNSDYPKIDTGPDGTGQQSIWISYEEASEMKVSGAQVTGLGAAGTFSTPVVVGPASDDPQFQDIDVGPNGQVFVAYQNGNHPNPCTVAGEIIGRTDPDGLGTQPFGAAVKVTDTNVCKFRAIPPQPRRTIHADPVTGWTPNNRLYLSYTDAPDPNSTDTNIFIRVSTDAGATWSAPTRINDDTTATSQFFQSLDIDATNNNVAVCWHDPRLDAVNNKLTDMFCSASTNGTTWDANVRMSGGSSNAADAPDPNEFGDYTGTAFHNNVVLTAWGDNSNSTGDNPDGQNSELDLYVNRATFQTGTQPTPTPVGPTPTPGDATPQPAPTGSVSGTTFGSGGFSFLCLFFGGCGPNPIGGVTVEAEPTRASAPSIRATTTSNSSGNYSFPSLEVGDYTMSATVQQQSSSLFGGGATTTQSCTVDSQNGPTSRTVTLAAGDSLDVDFFCPSGGGGFGGLFGLFSFLPFLALFGLFG